LGVGGGTADPRAGLADARAVNVRSPGRKIEQEKFSTSFFLGVEISIRGKNKTKHIQVALLQTNSTLVTSNCNTSLRKHTLVMIHW
jgi:hypothetical protein